MKHNWVFEERGEDPSPWGSKRNSGGTGEWHRCSGCDKRIFYPDGWTEFQKELTQSTAWMDDVHILDKQELNRRTEHPENNHGMDRGFHGVLANDCEKAQAFSIEYVMKS